MNAMKIAIYTLLVLGASVVLGSCQRGGDEDTAQVTLRLATRAATVTDQYGNLGDEGIKTLQIFLYRNEGGTYTFYRKDDVVENITAGAKTVTVELDDIKLGWYRFYVVANGESVGLESIDENLPENNLKGMVIDNDYFPKKKSEIATNGLPMAGFTDVKVNNKSVSATIDLHRAVAKLDITLTNETGTPLTVNEINFGAFGANKAFLFKQESGDVPSEATYKTFNFPNLDTPIADGEEENFVFYVYPSNASSNYTIGLDAVLGENSETYPPVPLLDADGSELTEMPRNTLYKINAVVDVDAIRFRGITVEPWGESHTGGDINIGN